MICVRREFDSRDNLIREFDPLDHLTQYFYDIDNDPHRIIDPELNVALAARAYAATEVGTLLWWLDDPDRCEPDELTRTLLRLHPVVACRTVPD